MCSSQSQYETECRHRRLPSNEQSNIKREQKLPTSTESVRFLVPSVWGQKSSEKRFLKQRKVAWKKECAFVCVCVCVLVWARGREAEGVCAACVTKCVCVCVFSFKRRKTTVVTERSRKISYQIAEPTVVPRGLKRAAMSTITVPPASTASTQKLSPLKTKPSPHYMCNSPAFPPYYWHKPLRCACY